MPRYTPLARARRLLRRFTRDRWIVGEELYELVCHICHRIPRRVLPDQVLNNYETFLGVYRGECPFLPRAFTGTESVEIWWVAKQRADRVLQEYMFLKHRAPKRPAPLKEEMMILEACIRESK